MGRRRGDLPEHLDSEERLSLPSMLLPGTLLPSNSPHLGDQHPRQVVVFIEEAVEVGREIPDGHSGLGDPVVHERPQPIPSGAILHPPCLERRVLAIVREDEEALALSPLDQALRQDVHVRGGARPDLLRGLVVAPVSTTSDRAARKTARQASRAVFLLPHGVELDPFCTDPTARARTIAG